MTTMTMTTETTTIGATNAHPVDLVEAIHGGEKVTLCGFGAEPMPNTFVRAALRFVSADETPAAAIQFVRERQRSLAIIRGSVWALMFVSGIGLGIWINSFLTTDPVYAQEVAGAWSVVSVNEDGLVIRATDSNEQTKIQISAKLPNGEVLLSTIPARRAYMTNKSTIMLNPEPHKTAEAAK